jgi:hypothetical protein
MARVFSRRELIRLLGGGAVALTCSGCKEEEVTKVVITATGNVLVLVGEEMAKRSPDLRFKLVGATLFIAGKVLIVVADTRYGRSTIRRELSDEEVDRLKAKDDLKVKLAYHLSDEEVDRLKADDVVVAQRGGAQATRRYAIVAEGAVVEGAAEARVRRPETVTHVVQEATVKLTKR